MINQTGQVDTSHRMLLLPPLFIISLFCFSFVLLQPKPQSELHPTSTSNPKTGQSVTPKQQLPELTLSSQQQLPLVAIAPPKPTIPASTMQPQGNGKHNLQAGRSNQPQKATATTGLLKITIQKILK